MFLFGIIAQLSLLEVFKPCLALLGQFNALAMMGLCQGKHINNLDEVYLSKHVSASPALHSVHHSLG